MRVFLLLILAAGQAGTLAELWLAEHTEDAWQWVPVALLLLGLAAQAWVLASGAWRGDAREYTKMGAASVRTLQGLMALFVLSGLIGIGLHVKGKMEFKQESDPSLHGWKLFTESLTAKMPPALAPGAMIQLGLLGLVYAYRHPALRDKRM